MLGTKVSFLLVVLRMVDLKILIQVNASFMLIFLDRYLSLSLFLLRVFYYTIPKVRYFFFK